MKNIYINAKFPQTTQKSHSGGSEDEGPEALGCLHSCSGARFSGAALFGLNCQRKRRIIKFQKRLLKTTRLAHERFIEDFKLSQESDGHDTHYMHSHTPLNSPIENMFDKKSAVAQLLKYALNSPAPHLLGVPGEQGQEGEQDDGEGEVKWKLQVPRRDVVNFYFTNFPSDWNKVNLHDLFAEVGEIANVYVAKKVSKTGTFKLRANIARFDRYHSRSKQGSKKVDWVFDIPSKSNQIPSVKLSPTKNQNGRLKALVGESFLINSPSELQMIWKSFNVKDCKVTLMDGQRIMLDFTSMEGYDSTNFFDAERHVEKGTKIDTKEVNNVFGSFDGRLGENSSPIQTKLYSINVATDVAFPTSAPVPDEKDKSISKADMYCEGLDKVELDSSGPANMDSKIKKSDTTIKDYCHGLTTGRKDQKHNPSRLNLKWCRQAAFYEFIEEDSEYSNEDDDSQEDYDFDQNSRSQRRLSFRLLKAGFLSYLNLLVSSSEPSGFVCRGYVGLLPF
ncbi:hypothetical protein Tco_0403990 [Tanacetum coccineum]